MPTPEHRRGDGISLVMLVIAAASSAAAAFVVSRVWGTGTLIGAAVTPIIVAVLTELLRRPVTRVPDVRIPEAGPSAPSRPGEPSVHVYRSAPDARAWRLVAITALAAFVIGVGLYVALDRLVGGSGRLVPERRAPAQTVTRETQTMTVVTQRAVTVSTTTVERDRTVTVPLPGKTVTVPATTETVPPQTQATTPTSTAR